MHSFCDKNRVCIHAYKNKTCNFAVGLVFAQETQALTALSQATRRLS